MMHRILAVASMALFLASCAQQVTLDPAPDGDPFPVLTGVSVVPEQAVLMLGGQEGVQLTAEVTGVGSFDESVTWTSDDPSVATVSQSGLVAAVDDGIAVVTATSVFDPAGSGSATIRVQRAVVVENVTPVVSANLVPIDTVLTATFNVAMDPGTIDDTTFTLRVGTLPVAGTVGYDDASRTATFTPAAPLAPDTVYEAAISPEVRSASGGTLPGADGPERFAWSFWTAGAETGPEPAIGGIEVTPARETLVLGGSLQLTATPTGVVGQPDLSVTWSSSTPSVAMVSASGLVSAVGVGSATITATSAFDRTVSGSAVVNVDPAPVITLRYAGSPYVYQAGCGGRGGTPTCPGDDGGPDTEGVMTPPSDIEVGGASGPLVFTWDSIATDDGWSIDSASGVIFRSDTPPTKNLDDDRNGDRQYTVTVREGGGRSAFTVVAFVDDRSN